MQPVLISQSAVVENRPAVCCQVDGEWHTWIDYDKFHMLNDRFVRTGEPFTSLDYMAKTPAVGAAGGGSGGCDRRFVAWAVGGRGRSRGRFLAQ